MKWYRYYAPAGEDLTAGEPVYLGTDGKWSPSSPSCHWHEDADGNWRSDCGAAWVFNTGGTPTHHGMAFCFRCGRQLQATPYVEPVEVEK